MIFDERGGERVRTAIRAGKTPIAMSCINWCEVLTRLQRDIPHAGSEQMDALLPGVEIVPFARDVAEIAAGFANSNQALSLGDRACLALAKLLGATAWTADRIWKQLPLDVPIELIRN